MFQNSEHGLITGQTFGNDIRVSNEPTIGPAVVIHADQCKACGLCIEYCLKNLLHQGDSINSLGYAATVYLGQGCTGCGNCYYICPEPGGITVYPKPKKDVDKKIGKESNFEKIG
jgi:NAD-dependent dihydropyrimidine dehydrogenase PreA subunit